jgi:hypothetical protein
LSKAASFLTATFSTYLPTLTLLILVELTLFFDEQRTQLAIGFSLTIMLVMYTMFQVESKIISA